MTDRGGEPDEITRDVDPDWLAGLRDEPTTDVPDVTPMPARAAGTPPDFDAERTVGGDADLLAAVRDAVRQARQGLAAPPPVGALPPPVPAAHPPAVELPDPVAAPAVPTPVARDDRWRPPPRLRPAATPQPSALLADQPARRPTPRWLIVAIAAAVAVVVVVVLLLVRSSGSSPSDDTTNVSTTSVAPSTAPPAPVETVAPSQSVAP